MSKHVEAFKQKHLKSGEVIVATGEGYIGEMMGQGKNRQHNGVLLVSGERVVFYRKGLFGEVLESIPLKSITSIERKSLFGHRTIRLHTSHDQLEFKTISKAQEDSLTQAIESGRTADNTKTHTTVPASDALVQLAALRDAGIVTESEFIAKKAELLARM
jgi:Bacterial PH domain/Short C-terminal domain